MCSAQSWLRRGGAPSEILSGLKRHEGWWRVLRERLEQASPEGVETRAAFIARLRRTANWLNERRWEDGLKLCTNQKERAADVKLLEGAKTKW